MKLLSSCVDKGFDSILGFNLFLMDGIELNSPIKRQAHGIRTMFRPVGTYYGLFDGEFTAETEEIVVETKYFSFDDFLLIRALNFMYYSVFALGFYRWFFQFLRHHEVDLSRFMLDFIAPSVEAAGVSPKWSKLRSDFRKAIEGELFATREEAAAHLRALFEENHSEVREPVRQNVFYGARLLYLENDWVADALLATLKHQRPELDTKVLDTARFILRLCQLERVDLRASEILPPDPVDTGFDLVAWRGAKFVRPLESYLIEGGGRIKFSVAPDTLSRIASFRQEFGSADDAGYYYSALDFMNRRELLFRIDIEPKGSD